MRGAAAWAILLAGLSLGSCRERKAQQLPRDAGDGDLPSLMQFTAGKVVTRGPFECAWDPASGRGPVAQNFEDGSRIEICFQCGFKGYTGGLSIGGFNTPGFMLVPSGPIRGFKFLNIWCAFDETIHEPESGADYSFGWSQNFGEQQRGARLAYKGGKILVHSASRLVLEAENEGGCFRLRRFVHWGKGDRFVVFSQSLENVCDRSVKLDYWLGEDPWIGTYKSSEGDVGWAALKGAGGGEEGIIIRNEHKVDGKDLACAGLYDLGNEESGEKEGSFSNEANFIRLSPLTPDPSVVYWANRFAHEDSEIDPAEPLSNKSLTGFNIGWKGILLGKGEKLALGWAAGVADTGEPGSPPSCPLIPYEKWFPLPTSGIVFESEDVTLRMERSKSGGYEAAVEGRYVFHGAAGGKGRAAIRFPFMLADNLQYPHEISVDGTEPFTKTASGITFVVEAGASGKTEVIVRYVQKIEGCGFGYVTTSAKSWGMPVKNARFEIHIPAALLKNDPVIPAGFIRAEGKGSKGQSVFIAVFENYSPDEDIVVTWDCGAQGT